MGCVASHVEKTWDFAVSKNLSAHLNRTKFVQGVLSMYNTGSLLVCDTFRKSLKGAQATGVPPGSTGMGSSPRLKKHLKGRNQEAT